VDTLFVGGHSVCWWTLIVLVDIQFAGGHSLCWWTIALLVDTPFVGGHTVCWWTLIVLVDIHFAGGHLSFSLHSTNKPHWCHLSLANHRGEESMEFGELVPALKRLEE
jgi:hypothetical protein